MAKKKTRQTGVKRARRKKVAVKKRVAKKKTPAKKLDDSSNRAGGGTNGWSTNGGGGNGTTGRLLVNKDSHVAVRMYRQGLGDCFLLAFPTQNPLRPFYVMIDCGVILGTADAANRMKSVVRSIRAATDGRIDLLLATHEHWDHLSAFVQANDEFKELKVEMLWLAWTEDPGDALANELRGQRQMTKNALQAMVQRFGPTIGAPSANSEQGLGSEIESLLGFFGAGQTAGGNDTAAALNWIKDHAIDQKYCRPGEKPIRLKGTDGVRVYVLGPPHDKKQIKHSDATKKEIEGKVVYHLGAEQRANDAFFAAALGGDGLAAGLGDVGDADTMMPFDRGHRLRPDSLGRLAKDRPFHSPKLGYKPPKPSDEAKELYKKYFSKDPWRRVDSDWMDVGAALALKLDSDTNNTSLAVAIELKNGDVLLFPADAQVGNWTSWASLRWTIKDDQGEREVTAADLLARAVLYKVAHHASHNATLRAGGLEAMNGNLIAMMPVDHEMAVKKRWNMPFPKLLSALNDRCLGRVGRVDNGWPKKKPASLPEKEWKKFQNAIQNSTDLYLEYVHGRSNDSDD